MTTENSAPPQNSGPQRENPKGQTPEPEKPSHHIRPLTVIIVGLILAAIVAAVALGGYLPRRDREKAAANAAHEEATAVPGASVIRVKRAPSNTEVLLPGSMSPLTESSVFARASGYVKKRYVDIGDHVRAGQLMADIETPDLDQQVAQARAAVAQAQQQLAQTKAALTQAESTRDLAKLTNDRYQNLVGKGAIARQDADTQASNYKSAQSLVDAQQATINAAQENVKAAQANLDRVVALQEFQKVRAPFSGIVTARNIDAGSLISASGGGQGASPTQQGNAANPSGNELFRVAQLNILRIYVNVPQANVPVIQLGMPADVMVTEFPGRKFVGKVTRTANALDPTARTMLTEVQIPNTDGKLHPGMYAQILFKSHRDTPPILIPGDAIIAGQNGLQVAVLTPNADQQGTMKVHLQQIQVGRDYGSETEILQGLQGNETVVVNPGDEVREGAVVKPESEAKVPPPGASGAAPKAEGGGGSQAGGSQAGGSQAPQQGGAADQGAKKQ